MPMPLTVTLPVELAEEIRKAAAACGMSPEAFVFARLSVAAAEGGDDDHLDWREDARRLVEGGDGLPAQAVFDEIEARIEAARTPAK